MAVRWTATMTHRGDDLGFPASGRTARLAGSSFVIVKGGVIMEGWNQMEMQGLFQYLKGESQ